MAMTQHQEIPRQTKKSFDVKGFFGIIGSILAFVIASLLKLLTLVVMTPVFILFYLKNWAVIGVMTSIFYSIVGFLYYSNQPQYQNIEYGGIRELLWTDTSFMIVVIISAILAFFATYGEFSD